MLDGITRASQSFFYQQQLPFDESYCWDIVVDHQFIQVGRQHTERMGWTATPYPPNDGGSLSFSGISDGGEVEVALRECLLAINGWAKENGIINK